MRWRCGRCVACATTLVSLTDDTLPRSGLLAHAASEATVATASEDRMISERDAMASRVAQQGAQIQAWHLFPRCAQVFAKGAVTSSASGNPVYSDQAPHMPVQPQVEIAQQGLFNDAAIDLLAMLRERLGFSTLLSAAPVKPAPQAPCGRRKIGGREWESNPRRTACGPYRV